MAAPARARDFLQEPARHRYSLYPAAADEAVSDDAKSPHGDHHCLVPGDELRAPHLRALSSGEAVYE